MYEFLKNAVGWNRLPEAQKKVYRNKFDRNYFRVKGLLARSVSVFPFPLTKILQISGSDKHQENKPEQHLYGYTYSRIFSPYRFKRIKFLEIGIGGYGHRTGDESLLAWRAFFPFAKIFACDIEPKPNVRIPGVSVLQLDQSDENELTNLGRTLGKFDIIIDDGSHLSKHQILTFKILFNYLSSGGLYVVEDVMTSYWVHDGWDGQLVNSPEFNNTCIGYFSNVVKYINMKRAKQDCQNHHLDDLVADHIKSIHFEENLIIIEKH